MSSCPEPFIKFANISVTGDIPSFNGSNQAKATDYANYFCSYAQLYHQKQMLADHNRMAAYHTAIMENSTVFKDKVVMDVGAGSGILSTWCAQAGARRVYAIEYTDIANLAQLVIDANGLSDIVTVIQGAVEEVRLPIETDGLYTEEKDSPQFQVVDIIVSEWMGYFLLRESMLDSLIRARNKFLKPKTGLMFPSHATMYLAPVWDEDTRKVSHQEYDAAMDDWARFADTTSSIYGVDLSVLEACFEKEQKEYYLMSSRWSEHRPDAILSNPCVVKELDMMTCTLSDSQGITCGDPYSNFEFDIVAEKVGGPISGFAGWFTVDFKSRSDNLELSSPNLLCPVFLNTGPEAGRTHWGQQTFPFLCSIPVIQGETTRLKGTIEMKRTKLNSRMYNCRFCYEISRRKTSEAREGVILTKGALLESIYQIP